MGWLDRWRTPNEEPLDDALRERLSQLPREAEPERDLWLGIRNQITADATSREAEPDAAWRGGFRIPVWAASAAVVLLAVTTVGSALWLTSPQISLDDPEAVRMLAAELRERDGTGEVHANLQALLAERRDRLPPEVVTSIEANLAQIDRAIAELHLAFQEHPDNPTLQFLLAEAYRHEAELLERLEWWTQTREEARS
ncbi:MAG: hypothetical protein AAF430_03565 [Myxococcota bacterium]